MVYEADSQKETIQDFFIERTARTEAFNMDAHHCHDGYEVYYMCRGERIYFVKDRTYHVKEGDIVLVNMNDLHKTIEAQAPNHERILINFKPHYVQHMIHDMRHSLYAMFRDRPVLRLNVKEQGAVQAILDKMLQETARKMEGYETYVRLLLVELLLVMYRHTQRNMIPSIAYPNSLHERISEIVKYMNSQYMNNLTLPSIAKQFHISPYYLSRSYKEVTGFSFVAYINYVRVNEARKLLKMTKQSVTMIAGQVGYENPTHFGRVFKEVTGMTPLQYRKHGSSQERL